MSDLSIVSNAISLGTTYPPSVISGVAGEDLSAGDVVCRSSADGDIEKADADGASAYMKTVIGICVADAANGAACQIITEVLPLAPHTSE